MYKPFCFRRASSLPALAVMGIAGSAFVTPAMAQDSTARLVLEEVLVTATKTEELASDVAISANIMTSDDLSQVGATEFTDISRLAPGLDFASTGSATSGAIKLRNVGSDSFEGGGDKAVAVFIDQFAQANVNAAFSTLADIERVEVLRGPQGTLYGRNAPAGVISVATRNPDFDGISGYVKGMVGNYDTYKTEGALNVPLVDQKLALRVSAALNESDGYYYNDFLKNDSADKNNKDSRLKLLFVPNDDLVVLFAYRYAELVEGDTATLYDGAVPGSAGLGQGGGLIDNDLEDYTSYAAVNRVSDVSIKDAMLTVEWEVDDYTVTSLSAYSEYAGGINGGNNAIPVGDQLLNNFSATRQVTEELRLSNSEPEDVEWLAGIFYAHLKRSGRTVLPPRLDFGGDRVAETWGYFTNAIWYINDDWKMSAGLRYNDEKKAEEGSAIVGSYRESENFYNTSGSLKLQYYFNYDIMFYAALDSAYRSGDFNNFTLGFGASGLAPAIPGGSGFVENYSSYDAEESESFELGMKGSFLDGRARLNVTLFHQVFHDYQLNQAPSNAAPVASGSLAGRDLTNFAPSGIVPIDKLVTRGIEMDGEILLTEHWSAAGSASYAHAVAEEFSARLCAEGEAPLGTLVCPGDNTRLNDDPLWNANLQLVYEDSFGEFDYAARLISSYKSAPTYDNGSGQNEDFDRFNSDYFIFDANITVMPLDGRWSTQLWVKNITDEVRSTSEGTLQDTGAMGYNRLIPPRTYGVTAQYNF